LLDEILEERVKKQKNRSNPRGVKQKMSSFPIKRPLGKTKINQLEIKVIMVK